jgi:hypothetical protein
MANASGVGGHTTGFTATSRTDTWWLKPTLVVVGLGFFGLYYLWAAWQAGYYHVGPYTSPMYEPLLFSDTSAAGSAPAAHAWFGEWPQWWKDNLSFIPASPPWLVGFMPLVFRGTCYYYRKAYYRSFLGMPPACAVAPVPHDYKGETTFLIIQNLHRYTMYVALLLLPILFMGAANACFYDGQVGIGLGTLMIFGAAFWLTAYTVGCHSVRHLIAGRLNVFSTAGGRYSTWKGITWLNARHGHFAWISLYWFLCADLYIRLHSMGITPDINTWHGVTWAGDYSTASHAALGM